MSSTGDEIGQGCYLIPSSAPYAGAARVTACARLLADYWASYSAGQSALPLDEWVAQQERTREDWLRTGLSMTPGIGDLNDLFTIVSGHDAIMHEDVPYLSPQWCATVVAATLPVVSGKIARDIERAVRGGNDLPLVNGVLRYLLHDDLELYQRIQRLGARDGTELNGIVQGIAAADKTIYRAMTDREGRQITLSVADMYHTIGRHFTRTIPPSGLDDTWFSPTMKVGDVVDLIAETVHNGVREPGAYGHWVYTWTDPTWGEIEVQVLNDKVMTAYPVHSGR